MAISVHILFIIGIFSPRIIQLIARIHTCRLYPLSIAYVLPHYHCLCHHLSFAFIYALHFIFVTLFPIYFVLSLFFSLFCNYLFSHSSTMAIKCALIAEKSILKTLKRVRNTSAEVHTSWARKLHSTMINYGERNKTMQQFIFFIVFFPKFYRSWICVNTIHTWNTYWDDICRLLEWKRFTDRYVRCTNNKQRTWKKKQIQTKHFCLSRVCTPLYYCSRLFWLLKTHVFVIVYA